MYQETDKQVNMIISIAKYQFKWGRKAIFNYCVKTVPVMRGWRDFKKWEKNYSTSKLFRHMSQGQKSLVIKRLLEIQKRNTAKQELAELNK